MIVGFHEDGEFRFNLPSGEQVVIDSADLPLIEGRRWYRARRGVCTYAEGRLPDGINSGGVMLHRLISGTLVDHKNGNGLDNRRSNLRAATQQQNGLNRAPKRGKKFKGVYVDRRSGAFYAQIAIFRQVHTSPRFRTEEEAARWYDAKATELHGEFARLNFPSEVAA